LQRAAHGPIAAHRQSLTRERAAVFPCSSEQDRCLGVKHAIVGHRAIVARTHFDPTAHSETPVPRIGTYREQQIKRKLRAQAFPESLDSQYATQFVEYALN